jgi:hypothetical protein|tara:strand:- start:2900 stop:4069 length:1170 start_codon:yes stop_codon:yes gene_type:complete
MAKSYYELKEEEERLALMGGGYSPEKEAPIPSSLPSSVEASQRASGSRLNVLAESLAAAKRYAGRSPEEQATYDEATKQHVTDVIGKQFESSLTGANRGSGLRGILSRRKIKNTRDTREPELIAKGLASLSSQDQLSEMAERRKGYQAGEVAKAEFLAKYGAEAAQAGTGQKYAVTNAETAAATAAAAAEKVQENKQINREMEVKDATNQTFLDFRLEGWKTSTEANAGRGSAIAAMNRALDVNDAVNEGELTPLFAKGSSTLKSLGINIDEEGLNAYQEMNQVINALLRTDISVEGARGLTDKDMEILREARFDTKMTAKTRDKVLRLLIKHEEAGIDNYIDEWDSFTPEQQKMLGEPAAVRNNRGGYKIRKIARLEEEKRALLAGRP